MTQTISYPIPWRVGECPTLGLVLWLVVMKWSFEEIKKVIDQILDIINTTQPEEFKMIPSIDEL